MSLYAEQTEIDYSHFTSHLNICDEAAEDLNLESTSFSFRFFSLGAGIPISHLHILYFPFS